MAGKLEKTFGLKDQLYSLYSIESQFMFARHSDKGAFFL